MLRRIFNCGKAESLVWFACVVIALLVPAARGHNVSVTLITVKAERASVTVTLHLNQADLLEHALKRTDGSAHFADRTELEDAAPRQLAYVIANIAVRADGHALAAPWSMVWPPQHVELTHVDATGLEVPSAIPMTLYYVLPAGTRRIELTPRLYRLPGFSATFDLSIYAPWLQKPVVAIVARDESFSFELPAEASKTRGDENALGAAPRVARRATRYPAMHVTIVAALVILAALFHRRRRRRRSYVLIAWLCLLIALAGAIFEAVLILRA